jgi:hypothetical protein
MNHQKADCCKEADYGDKDDYGAEFDEDDKEIAQGKFAGVFGQSVLRW